jgi:hypothetical protein
LGFFFVDTPRMTIAYLGHVHFVGPAILLEKANSFRRIHGNHSFTMINHELVNRFERRSVCVIERLIRKDSKYFMAMKRRGD